MDHARVVHGCCGDTHGAHAAFAQSCCGDVHGAHAAFAHACCSVPRHFVSKDERREALEAYKDQLKKELAGVDERLQELA
jgi:hypothetical protein